MPRTRVQKDPIFAARQAQQQTARTMGKLRQPQRGELIDAPFDPRTMTRRKPVAAAGGRVRMVTVEVAASYGEAQLTRKDYYHPGGIIVDHEGHEVGEHDPGWFVGGYKWAVDPVGYVPTLVGSDGVPLDEIEEVLEFSGSEPLDDVEPTEAH